MGILFSTKRHMPTLAVRFARVAADNTGWSTVLKTANSWGLVGPCWHLEMPLKSLCYEVLVIYMVIWHFDTICGVPDSIVLTFVLNRSIVLASVIHFFRLRCFSHEQTKFFSSQVSQFLGPILLKLSGRLSTPPSPPTGWTRCQVAERPRPFQLRSSSRTPRPTARHARHALHAACIGRDGYSWGFRRNSKRCC